MIEISHIRVLYRPTINTPAEEREGNAQGMTQYK